ncbi:la protein 1-like [Magnolia sinica]|uniref:la protein 1-like n=1 Tax=Magnolia sinica TaxID=86752 RepID=UPI00265A0969|nr:la protein 1-like [Magnolia sinica]
MAIVSWDEEKANEILRQVEFYLSDSNLPRDNFIMKSIKDSEDGLMSLALICTYTRMRSLLGFDRIKPDEIPEQTLSAVAEILKKSSFLRLSEDGKRVGRITEMSKLEEVIEQVDTRTIAVSPLEYNAKHDDVEVFFNQHGKVNSVRLPRHVADKRCFSGTALIEFATEEDAKHVLNQSLVYAGVELELKPKRDYDSEREKKLKELEDSRPSFGVNKQKGPAGNENFPKGLIIAFRLKPLSMIESTIEHDVHQEVEIASVSKSEEELNSTENVTESELKNSENVKDEEKATADATEGTEEKTAEDAAQESDEATNQESEEETGVAEEMVSREDLKQVFQTFGPVKYVDFRMGEESGFIRFEEPEAAAKARAAAVLLEAGGLVVKNCIASLEPVTGEAEKVYWSQLRENLEKHHRDHHNYNYRGGRGRGRNNRGGRRFDGRHYHSRGRHYR